MAQSFNDFINTGRAAIEEKKRLNESGATADEIAAFNQRTGAALAATKPQSTVDVFGVDGSGGLFGGGGLLSAPRSDFQAQGVPVDPALGQMAKAVYGQSFTAPTAQAAQIDRSGFDAGIAAQGQSRAVQAGLAGAGGGLLAGFDPRTQQSGRAVNLAESAALGQQPSAAAIQQQAGLEDAMRAQLSMAASARGGAGAQIAAQRAAARNTADLQQRGVRDAAALRAQEMATARGQFGDLAAQQVGQTQSTLFGLGNLATQARGQDIQTAGLAGDLATQQAQLQQQTVLANQDANLQAQTLGLQSQLGGIGALQGFEGLRQDAALDPQRIQAAIEAAELSGDQQLKMALLGGAFKGAGGALGLFGIGG